MAEKEMLEELKAFIERHSKNASAASHAVGELFPKAAGALGAFWTDSSRFRQTVDFAISNKDFSAAYFSLAPIRVGWRKEELERILGSDGPIAALTEVEERISQSPERERFRLRRTFLEQLESAFETGRSVLTQDWLNALIKMSPVYIGAPDELSGEMFAVDFLTRLEITIIRGLEKQPAEVRGVLFGGAIRHAEDLSLLCSVFRTIAGDVNPSGDTDRITSADFGEVTKDLRFALLGKVNLFASDERIWRQADLKRVLWFWWGANREEEVRSFTKRAMDSQEGVRALLTQSIHLIRSTEGNYEVVSPVEDKIMNVALLARRAEVIVEQHGDDEEGRLAQRFLSALQNRSKR